MMKTVIFHIAAWSIILLLSYNALRLQKNQVDQIIQDDLDKILPTLLHSSQNYLNIKIKNFRKYIVEAPIALQKDRIKRVTQIIQHTDSLTKTHFYKNILNDFNKFLEKEAAEDKVVAMALSGIASQDSFGLMFKPPFLNSNIAKLYISQQLRRMEFSVLDYYERRVNPNQPGCFFTEYTPTLGYTDLGRATDEKIRADFVFEEIDRRGFAEMTFFIDGKQMKRTNDIVHFERRYSKPGVYPLKASILARKMRSDSLCTWEKTFYLKVQE